MGPQKQRLFLLLDSFPTNLSRLARKNGLMTAYFGLVSSIAIQQS